MIIETVLKIHGRYLKLLIYVGFIVINIMLAPHILLLVCFIIYAGILFRSSINSLQNFSGFLA